MKTFQALGRSVVIGFLSLFLVISQPGVSFGARAVAATVEGSTGAGPYAEPGTTILDALGDSTILRQVNTEKGHLAMVAGRSRVLRLKRKVGRISVSDPEILDFVILSPTEILLNAAQEGAVNLILWDQQNNLTVFDITVTQDPTLLLEVLKRISPESNFEVYPYNEVFVVKGDVPNVRLAAEVAQAAEAFAEGSVSLVRVEETKQILLKIRFVRIENTQDFNFGMDFQYINQQVAPLIRMGNTGGSLQDDGSFSPKDGAASWRTFSEIPDTQGVHFIPYVDESRALFAFIQALETKGVGKVIARPNLLASDGEEASFLVGGESAIVAISDSSVGVDYKEYGTRLTFTPEILQSDKIRLTVEPEVSQIDPTNSVVVNGVQIPSFLTVRTSTVAELMSEQTLLIGGLVQQIITTTDAGVPFLRRLPFVGKLFQETDYDYSDTELLVFVTPILVEPQDGALEGEDELFDIAGAATAFDEFRYDDERREEMQKYLQNDRVHVHNNLQRFSAASTPRFEMQRETDRQDLDNLQNELEWKEIDVGSAADKAKTKVVAEPSPARPVAGGAQSAGNPNLKVMETELLWEPQGKGGA